MQLVAYLFNPEIPARFNKPNTVRNTVTWNKPLKIYKGADNFLDVVINDFDLQPLAVNLYTFKFKVKDNNNNTVLIKQMGFRQNATNRLALDLLEEDLASLNVGLYVWGLSLIDERGKERPIYLELNGEAESTFQLSSWFAGAI
jgi:hypothetical protein